MAKVIIALKGTPGTALAAGALTEASLLARLDKAESNLNRLMNVLKKTPKEFNDLRKEIKAADADGLDELDDHVNEYEGALADMIEIMELSFM